MTTLLKIVSGLALMAFVSACGGREEPMSMAPMAAPSVSAEPTYSKY